jgi:hypothetical protein
VGYAISAGGGSIRIWREVMSAASRPTFRVDGYGTLVLATGNGKGLWHAGVWRVEKMPHVSDLVYDKEEVARVAHSRS